MVRVADPTARGNPTAPAAHPHNMPLLTAMDRTAPHEPWHFLCVSCSAARRMEGGDPRSKSSFAPVTVPLDLNAISTVFTTTNAPPSQHELAIAAASWPWPKIPICAASEPRIWRLISWWRGTRLSLPLATGFEVCAVGQSGVRPGFTANRKRSDRWDRRIRYTRCQGGRAAVLEVRG